MLDKALAVSVLVIVYVLMISERVHRTVAVIGGSVVLVGTRVLDGNDVVNFIHWEALGLIFGMFVLVAALAKSGFFRWIGLHMLKATKFNAFKMFLFTCSLSAFLAAFMDSITVLIFMASLVVETCRMLKIPVIPFLIGLITSANIGGSATMVGDPPNVVIGTALNMGFLDFVTNTGPIAIVIFGLNFALFYVWYRRMFNSGKVDVEKIYKEHEDLRPESAIKDLKLMRISLIVFAFTVTLLVLHQLLDIGIAFVAILGAAIVLILAGKGSEDLIHDLDWHTIIFLAGLFVLVGGLEKTGILSDIANGIVVIGQGNAIIILTLILWIAALASSAVDNVPFAAAMVPVIQEISLQTGMPVSKLGFTLALGCDIGGNGTPIGASANVVGLAVAEKSDVHVSWKEYCRSAFPIMIITMLVVNLLVLLTFL
ncbi:MAG: ArsB/NhaD family transporter [Thermoplasmata archaeon]